MKIFVIDSLGLKEAEQEDSVSLEAKDQSTIVLQSPLIS